MKPTHNAISPEGSKVFSPTFDTLGFFARDMDDLQLLANIFALKDDAEPSPDLSLKTATVALIKTPMWSRAGPGTVAAMEKAAKIPEENGVTVEEITLPGAVGSDAGSLKHIHKIIMASEARVTFLKEYRIDAGGSKLAPEIRHMVENCGNYTHAETVHAMDKLASMRPIMDKLLASYSAILAPSAVDEAPLGLGDMGSATFNTIWTVSPFTPLYTLQGPILFSTQASDNGHYAYFNLTQTHLAI